jgi:hypothetical protein
MRGKLVLGTIAALLLAGGVTAVAATHSTNSATRAASSEQVIRLVTHNVVSGYLDLGDANLSTGDQVPFSNDLYRDGSKVGEDGGWCVLTRIAGGASTYECVGTNSLPDGQLTAQGLVTYGLREPIRTDPYFLAITGGTGKYRGARGEVRIQEVSSVEARLTFRIVLG